MERNQDTNKINYMRTNYAIQKRNNIRNATNRIKKVLDANYKKGKFIRNNK